MAVKIRLKRLGAKKAPFYRIVEPKTTSTKINVNTASAMNACNIIPSANPLEPVAVGPP